MKHLLVSLISLLILTPIVNAKPDCSSIKGEWVNEKGSLMLLEKIDYKTGQISGSYRSSSGTEGQKFPLIGWINRLPVIEGKDNALVISMTVRWGKYGSITSWIGTCMSSKNGDYIETLWNLARSNSDYVWDHIITNKAVFKPRG